MASVTDQDSTETTCDYIHGEATALKDSVETWRVPGIDGYGAQNTGKGDSHFSFVLVKFDSLANVNTWISTIEALQGQVITVVDDWGNTHSNCLLVNGSVGRPIKQAARGAGIEGDSPCRCEITIRGVICN